MTTETAAATTEGSGLNADELVLQVYQWMQGGAQKARVLARLKAKDWTVETVRQACAMVTQAATSRRGEVEQLATDLDGEMEAETTRNQAAITIQEQLLTQAMALVEQAERVLVFFRPEGWMDESSAAAESAPAEPEHRGFRITDLRDPGRLLDLFRENVPEPEQAVTASPTDTVRTVTLPAAGDAYMMIEPILEMGDKAIEAVQEWDEIRELSIAESSTPERELAEMATTYATLRPLFERALLMAQRQVEQSRGIIQALRAHMTRFHAGIEERRRAIATETDKLTGYETAATEVAALLAE